MSIFKQKLWTILYLIIIILIISSIGYFITKKENLENIGNTTNASNKFYTSSQKTTTADVMAKMASVNKNTKSATSGNISSSTTNNTTLVSGNVNTTSSTQSPMSSKIVVDGNVKIAPTTKISGNTNVSKYDSNNYDVQYHDNISDIQKQNGIYDSSFGEMYVKDPSGNLVSIAYVEGQALPTYYQPGSFTFSPSNYVPNYEDSVYLSRTTGLSTLGKIKSVSSMQGGFCNQMVNDKTMLEQKCNSLSTDVCASTSCCVLVGGSKCTSGNESGPVMKSIYSDPTLKNKDYYYYQGKCYGNCL